MPEGGEPLNLTAEFLPVSTEAWEQAIAADLKGADYQKKLVWKTEEGIAVKPYYRAGDAAVAPVRPDSADWAIADTPPAHAINAAAFHEAGATAVEELAFGLAEASDALAAGKSVPAVCFSVGSNYFFEIAKLRAARVALAKLTAAYKVPGAVKIHAVTSLANKSIYDPYTNLLRVTTEALSAATAGVESLTVQPAAFQARLAKNVQLILKEEAHLDKVADPAGGSYYIEAITDSIAAEAWKLFQQLEAEGGFAKAQGTIEARLAASRAAKEKAVASRRRTMVGVNNYPDLGTMVGVNNYPDLGERELEHAGALDKAGWRMARSIEAIRLRTERHAAATGKTPKVLLLKRGDLKMKMARAQFCQNFLGCAGFDIVESDALEPADLVVLCSSDPEYLEFAREICGQAKSPVLVAGNPKEQIEELKAAGVAGFVHVLSNLVETLTALQDGAGVGKESN